MRDALNNVKISLDNSNVVTSTNESRKVSTPTQGAEGVLFNLFSSTASQPIQAENGTQRNQWITNEQNTQNAPKQVESSTSQATVQQEKPTAQGVMNNQSSALNNTANAANNGQAQTVGNNSPAMAVAQRAALGANSANIAATTTTTVQNNILQNMASSAQQTAAGDNALALQGQDEVWIQPAVSNDRLGDLVMRDTQARLVSLVSNRLQEAPAAIKQAPIQAADLAVSTQGKAESVAQVQQTDGKQIQPESVKFQTPSAQLPQDVEKPASEPSQLASLPREKADFGPVANTHTDQPTNVFNADRMMAQPVNVVEQTTTVQTTTLERVLEVQKMVEVMSRQVARRVSEGGGTVRMNLHPPELGQVKLEVTVTREGVSTDAYVQNAQAKQVLLDQVHMLRQLLADRGLNLERFDVNQQLARQEAQSGFSQQGQSSERMPLESSGRQAVGEMSSNSVTQTVSYRLRGFSGNLSVVA